MKNLVALGAWVTFGLAALLIVFVRAGQRGGMSGGEQAATILKAAGTSYATGVGALTGA